MSRVFQWIIIILVLTALGGGYWYWKNARAGQTVAVGSSSDRADFEAPLKTNLELAAGSGIATYARADGADGYATVTDFEGIIRPVKSGEARFVGARRVENTFSSSQAFDNAYWFKLDSATATANQAVAPDGTMTADLIDISSASGTPRIGRDPIPNSSNPNRVWRYSLYLRSVSGTGTWNIRYRNADNSFTDNLVTIDSTWRRYSVLIPGVPSSVIGVVAYVGYKPSSTIYQAYAWGAQIEEVTGQANQNPSEYVSTGVKTAFPYHGAGVDGVKYFDYQNGNTVASNTISEINGPTIPDATLKGYLAEGQQTNFSLQSESLDNASWVKSDSTITADAAVSPSGKTNADLVTEGSGGGASVSQNLTVSAATSYAFSVYLKAGNHDWTRVAVYQQSNTNNQFRAWVNLTTGVLGATGATGTATYTGASIQSAGNGWYRVTIIGMLAGTDGTISTMSAVGDNSTTRVSGGTRYAWGAQIEQQLFSASYIPTTTASVTRSYDTLAYVGASNFNNTNGTTAFETTTEWTGGVGLSAYFIDDSSTYQRMAVWHWNGSSNLITVDRSEGGGVRNNYDYGAAPITSGTMMRLAQRWSSTSNTLFRDGLLRGSDTTLTLPYGALSGISIGIRPGASSPAYATIRNVRSWKQAMSDTFINSLTAGQSGVEKKTTEKSSDNTGLVGYWSFEDGRGTQATDFSPVGNNTGTLTNGPTWTDGKMGKAVNFDGVDDYVSMPDQDVFSPVVNDLTVSFWAKIPTNAPAVGNGGCGSEGSNMLSKGNPSGWEYTIENDNNTKFCVNLFQSTGFGYATVSVDKTLNDGKWHHYSMSMDYGVLLTVYIDGVSVGSTSTFVSWMVNTTAPLEIGRRGDGKNFAGSIDEVRVYSRALSATEIADLYTESAHTTINDSRNGILTNGLVGQWSFNGPDVSGTTAYDRSGQGNNGTLTNGPTAIPGKIGQGLYFPSLSRVDIPNSASLNNWNAQTVAFWIKFGTTTPLLDSRIIEKGLNNEWTLITNASQGGGGVGKITLVKPGAGTPNLFSTPALNDGSWHHVGVTISTGDPATVVLYVDGAAINTTTTPQPGSKTGDISIGKSNGGSSPTILSSIDEVRVYNRALSQSEINDLYLMGR